MSKSARELAAKRAAELARRRTELTAGRPLPRRISTWPGSARSSRGNAQKRRTGRQLSATRKRRASMIVLQIFTELDRSNSSKPSRDGKDVSCCIPNSAEYQPASDICGSVRTPSWYFKAVMGQSDQALARGRVHRSLPAQQCRFADRSCSRSLPNGNHKGFSDALQESVTVTPSAAPTGVRPESPKRVTWGCYVGRAGLEPATNGLMPHRGGCQ